MIQNEKFEKDRVKPLILFSPLDWGLGHTTRCIPLIRECTNLGCEVVIACNSTQRQLLEQEFPKARFVHLDGYNVQYTRKRVSTRLKLLFQLPHILTKIKKERGWLNEFLSENTVSAVVSDNRYGFSKPGVPCIFITHQLSVHTGGGKIFDKITQVFLYKWISRFTACWVPDYQSEPSLSGILSHPKKLPPVPVKYIGPVSRFTEKPPTLFVYDVMILLSGPEPQRTLLENILLEQLPAIAGLRILLIRGLPGQHSPVSHTGIRILPHAPAEELNQLICQSALVIARSGYTTIMDLLKLQKKMVLIPTPGQPEQEYLAKWLSENKMAIAITQHSFSLEAAMRLAGAFAYKPMNRSMEEYKPVIGKFIDGL